MQKEDGNEYIVSNENISIYISFQKKQQKKQNKKNSNIRAKSTKFFLQISMMKEVLASVEESYRKTKTIVLTSNIYFVVNIDKNINISSKKLERYFDAMIVLNKIAKANNMEFGIEKLRSELNSKKFMINEFYKMLLAPTRFIKK